MTTIQQVIKGNGTMLRERLDEMEALVDGCEYAIEVREAEQALSAAVERAHEIIEKCHDKRALFACIEGGAS